MLQQACKAVTGTYPLWVRILAGTYPSRVRILAGTYPSLVHILAPSIPNSICANFYIQKRVELIRQGMNTIISSLVILHYDQFFHNNLRRIMYGKSSCVVVSAAYLPKLFIHCYYHGVIVILGSSMI